jgi:hypothetical protein
MVDIGPTEVARRLSVLRRISVTERDEEARARLARERPTSSQPFELTVHRRLRELRALCELASVLHRGAASLKPARTNQPT